MNGEKTMVYWIGLILLGAASVFLFGFLWMFIVILHPSHREIVRSPLIPMIVGGVVFVLIGIYMMRTGLGKSSAEGAT